MLEKEDFFGITKMYTYIFHDKYRKTKLLSISQVKKIESYDILLLLLSFYNATKFKYFIFDHINNQNGRNKRTSPKSLCC